MTQFKYILDPLSKFLALEFVWLTFKYLVQRNNRSNYPNTKYIFRLAIELIVNKFKIIRTDNSFAGEFQTTMNILSKIGDHPRYLVDIGASNGITQSSTVKFLDDYKYSGLLLECESDNFSKLVFLHNDRNDITLTRNRITLNNIVAFMVSHAVPEDFSFLNLDIDSFDLEILRSLLVDGFKPKVISLEINEIFPPNIEFEVSYSPEHSWQRDHFFGASVAQTDKTLRSLGYSLVEIEYNNAFFVRNSLADKFDLRRNIFELYDQGYRAKLDKRNYFPRIQMLNSCLLPAQESARRK